jgi:hypothetical protein
VTAPYDRVLAPLCTEQSTYEQLLEAVAQALGELEAGEYVVVHGDADCTEDECVCGRAVVVGPLGATA